jgi:hypothetical protein
MEHPLQTDALKCRNDAAAARCEANAAVLATQKAMADAAAARARSDKNNAARVNANNDAADALKRERNAMAAVAT